MDLRALLFRGNASADAGRSARPQPEQVLDLVYRGVTDFHFYTMNRADLVYAVCHLLGLRPSHEASSDANRAHGALPLPAGERAGVRGVG